MSGKPSLILNGKEYPGSYLEEKARQLSQEGSSNERALGAFLLEWMSDTATVRVRTSGSTGPPRLLELEKQRLLASARATGDFLNLGEHRTALLCLPVSSIAGIMMVVRAMVYRLNLVMTEPAGHPFAQLPPEVQPDFTALVPVQVFNSLANETEKRQLSAIKTVIIGGGSLPPALEKKLSNFPNQLYATYGMTETLSHIALRRLSGSGRSQWFTALPGISVSTDDRGCLVINASRIADGPIVTNDLAELSGSNTFRIIGRTDFVINRGGVKLQAEVLERKLGSLLHERLIIAGIEDKKYGQLPVLIVENKSGREIDKKQLLRDAESILSYQERPVEVYFLRHFPETPTGKTDRREALKQALEKDPG